MYIGIHAKALSERNPTGVAEYTRNLLDHLVRLPEAVDHQFLFYIDSPDVNCQRSNVKCRLLHSPILWTQFRLALALRRHKPDILFVPQHVLPLTAPKKSVVTIHGLEFERYPQFYPWRQRLYLRYVTKDAVKRAAHIIAVSNATKQDLMELYKVPEEKITVVYHGVTHDSQQTTNNVVSRQLSVVSPYFLYIGRIELKKNVYGIIKAFAIAKEKYKLPHRLVLVGGGGNGAERIKLHVTRYMLHGAVQFLGYITKEQKWNLLRNAAAFVFPSWYEGFGLPILEAQAAGVPVITSNISAMPEVAGDAAAYVDPADAGSIADTMHRVVADANLRTGLIIKGKENLKRFSWEKCARETLAVVTSL